MESEIAGWLSVVFRFIHVIAAIMWIGNSLLFTWMEINLIAPQPDEEKRGKLGHLDMLHGGGVFHLEKRLIDPVKIPVPLHWFMWQSYTTWISGVLLLVSVFYIHGGAALLNADSQHLQGMGAIGLSVAGILGWWVVYDVIWRSKLKEFPKIAIPLTLILLMGAAYLFNQWFNGRALYLQIGAMLGSSMSANVFIHIIRNQKKFMASLAEGKAHDMKYGKAAKTRSLHNHYITFPVLFMMLSAHFPQVTSAGQKVPILAVIILALMCVKHLMNSRTRFRYWAVSIVGTFVMACFLIGGLLAVPSETAAISDPVVEAGAKLFVSQGCAACHQEGSAQLGPSLQGIFGTEEELVDGSMVLVDEGYLRESIRNPQSKVVKGFAAAMPPYAHLSEEDVDELVAYLKSL